MPKVHNFSAGPGILPQEAIDNSIAALQNFAGTNLSLIEVSHRGKEFEAVLDEAVATVKELFNVPEGYSVLFLQGGASMQFCMIPYNLLDEGQTAAYVNTGVWAKKAIKEAKLFGNVNVIASSEDQNFNYIPKGWSVPSDAAYLHITSNNTIYGTQYQELPSANIPVICDMSSDIFSRPVDVSKFDMIYAGAQKNMGPAGVTLVIVKDSILGKVKRAIPSMLDYRIHIEGGSMYNTPPVFPIYVSLQTLKWVKSNGGVVAMQKRNQEKADLLYGEIDRNPLFKGTAATEDRSVMNVTFVLNDDSLNDEFMALAKQRNLSGLKGHRSVGGFRASIYNALSIESVQALVDAMQEFERMKSGAQA
ncbi:MAG: 3-phosphoserine/phosphohydroxythreonine transaminase [Bacteroidetes bacterium]|nr:MAG: 3-phosphoserine/phosphohydroxythreonine transaminase [Bacteroidota bacterium]